MYIRAHEWQDYSIHNIVLRKFSNDLFESNHINLHFCEYQAEYLIHFNIFLFNNSNYFVKKVLH